MTMTRLTASEHDEQVCVVQWAHAHGRTHPLFLLTAIPNQGAGRNKRLQKEGTRPGFPDLFLPYPSGRFHGAAIEMKTVTGVLSDDQRWWMRTLRKHDYCAVVCKGADAAIQMLKEYLALGGYHA